jgi:hypothetical protein
MNTDLKVSFYLKRERKSEKSGDAANPVFPIVGKFSFPVFWGIPYNAGNV